MVSHCTWCCGTCWTKNHLRGCSGEDQLCEKLSDLHAVPSGERIATWAWGQFCEHLRMGLRVSAKAPDCTRKWTFADLQASKKEKKLAPGWTAEPLSASWILHQKSVKMARVWGKTVLKVPTGGTSFCWGAAPDPNPVVLWRRIAPHIDTWILDGKFVKVCGRFNRRVCFLVSNKWFCWFGGKGCFPLRVRFPSSCKTLPIVPLFAKVGQNLGYL